MIQTSLRCECGGLLQKAETEKFDLGKTIKKRPWVKEITCEVTGAPCLTCDSCKREIVCEETREELLDALTLSIANAWRRLYPEDVGYLRARLNLGKTDFERKIGIAENALTVLDYPGVNDENFHFPIEDHHSRISDVLSDKIKSLASKSVPDSKKKIIQKKWSIHTLCDGSHQLTTHSWHANSLTRLKSSVAELMAVINKAEEACGEWLRGATNWCVRTGYATSESVPGMETKGVLISKHSVESDDTIVMEQSLYAVCDGSYTLLPSFNNEKTILSFDEVIEAITHISRRQIWTMPVPEVPAT
jgi:hypothetical protein